jgi:DNA-binding SARP family transcriptional activator
VLVPDHTLRPGATPDVYAIFIDEFRADAEAAGAGGRGRMRFRILGPLETFDGSCWAGLGASKPRTLLATLLINAGSVVSLDQISAELWGESPPKTAANQVYGYVMRLRRLLGDSDGRLLVRRSPGYQLAVAPEEIDSGLFAALVEQGDAALRAGQAHQAAEHLAEALALWRGPALVDVPVTPLVEAATARLQEQRLAAVEARVEADLACGRHAAVVGELRDLLNDEPLREQLWAHLMLALYRCGRQADALAAYQRLHRLLNEELGIEPAAALQRLHQRILQTDPDLDPPGASPPPAAVTGAGPPAPVEAPRHLPADVSGFTGRTKDLKALDELLDDRTEDRGMTIAVITGTAGVGKTTLAVRWAHHIARQYPDGQLYANLRGYSGPAPVRPIEVLTQFLRALGVAPEQIPVDVDEAAARFRSLVADKRVLLLLDNAASADQVQPLLPGSPTCAVIITSRDRLGALVAGVGASPLCLDTLPPQDALDLLTRVVGRGRVWAEPDVAAELARLCGYLPLALRVAAANLASRPHQRIASYVAELAAEEDRLAALMVDGDEQTAVHAAFDMSYQRLPEPAQRLFRLLGLVPGPSFGPDAAAALAGTTATQARRLLDRLASAHMIDEIGESRFGFHDLLRHFAGDRARHDETAADRDAASRRLLTWYLQTIDTAGRLLYPRVLRMPTGDEPAGPPARFDDHVGARAWLDAERANLVAAVRHAAEHGPAAEAWRLADALRGYFRLTSYTVDWLAVANAGRVAADLDADAHARTTAHLNLADAHRNVGDYGRALDHYAEALAAARDAGWREAEATVLGNMGTVHWYLGRLEEAAEHYHQSVELHRSVGRRIGMANASTSLGGVYLELGRLTEVIELYEQNLRCHRELDSRDGEAIDLHALGEAYHALGQFDVAIDHHQRALALYREIGDLEGEAAVLTQLSSLHRDAGRLGDALSTARAAHAITTRSGERRTSAAALNALGAVHQCLGQPAVAVGHHERARALARQAGLRLIEAEALLGQAAAREPPQAVADAREALSIAREHGYRVLEGRALAVLARLALDGGDPARALAHTGEALASQRETGHRLGAAHTLYVRGLAHERGGAAEDALACWREALDLFRALGTPEADRVGAEIQRLGLAR